MFKRTAVVCLMFAFVGLPVLAQSPRPTPAAPSARVEIPPELVASQPEPLRSFANWDDDDNSPLAMGKKFGDSCKKSIECDDFFKCIGGACGGCNKTTECPTNWTCNKKVHTCEKMK
jgi:hypothetical protein